MFIGLCTCIIDNVLLDSGAFRLRGLLFDLYSQNGCRRPFWMTENHFRSHFSPFQIKTQLFYIFCSQNGCRPPFWMTENHFRSHFSPFQIKTHFFLYFWSFLIAFVAISDQYTTIFFHKMAAAAILDDWKSRSIAFLAISDQYTTFFLFIEIFFQNGHQRPFWKFDFH